jgi:hypothetical protein
MVFTYYIVPAGGHAGQKLVSGSLYVSDIESAKRHVQNVSAHGVAPQPGLEAVLLDSRGVEIWRGPYLGETAT